MEIEMMGINHRFRIGLLLILLIIPQSASAGEATEVVARLQSALLSTMKDADRLGFEGRYRLLEPVVVDTHDLPFIARIALGRHWRTLNEEQRAMMISTFQRLSIASYAGRFDTYTGKKFKIGEEKPLPRGQGRMVESRMIKPDGENVQFTYLLHHVNNQWRIVNIIVNGVSDLALKRAEYNSLLEREGFQALIAKLEEQIRGYAEGSKK